MKTKIWYNCGDEWRSAVMPRTQTSRIWCFVGISASTSVFVVSEIWWCVLEHLLIQRMDTRISPKFSYAVCDMTVTCSSKRQDKFYSQRPAIFVILARFITRMDTQRCIAASTCNCFEDNSKKTLCLTITDPKRWATKRRPNTKTKIIA